MSRWQVQLTDEADEQLRKDFLSRKLTQQDIRVIKSWISEIENEGLDHAQGNLTWRDHKLDGKWTGYRAISFSYSGRVIYCVEDQKIIVRVVKVTINHDYS